MGPIILKAWSYSLETGSLSSSHLESVITLLPKEGKDTKDIKNWRPITLSNCDSKIITEALSQKTAKVLESIIDPSQTAYVPGRSVADNLRSNFFYKNYCSKNNLNADKTEILNLNSKEKDQITFRYNDKSFEISTVEKIKIWGLFYCTDLDEEYRLNVSEKIKKLSYKIKLWTHS